jgi:hypothetical protein
MDGAWMDRVASPVSFETLDSEAATRCEWLWVFLVLMVDSPSAALASTEWL